MTWSRAWTTAAIWFAGSRAVILLLGLVGAALFVDQRTLTIAGADALDPAKVWHKWDSIWYERIARDGYAAAPGDTQAAAKAGFFPLYPVLVGLVLQAAPRVPFFWAGAILSNALALLALAWLVRALLPRPLDASRVMLLTTCAAGSFYFSLPYTESLFLLLVVATMVFTREKRYLLAAAAAGLGAVTRIHGLALVAIPIVACLLDRSATPASRFRQATLGAALFATPLLIHMVHLSMIQGDAGAFVTRQAMWDNAFPYPLKAIAGLWVYPHRLSGWLHGGFWALYVGLLVRYWRRLPLGEALFAGGALLISTQQESFHGIYRYVMVLVPVTIALADDREGLGHAVLAINLVFGTLMILAFVTNNRLTV